MQFIEALKLRSKLLFIFVLITIGLVIIGIMGAINVNTMKKNLDNLYFGSLVPVTELGIILQTYSSALSNTIYKARNSQLTPAQIKLQIKSSLVTIDKEWAQYKSHFKRYEELGYIEYTDHEIESVNRYFINILKAMNNGKDIKVISINNFDSKIRHIHQVVNKLIDYEVNIAKYERKNFLRIYDSLLLEVGSILLIVIFGVMIISFYVFKSIQNDQTKLEIATKKLKIANKKLESVSYTDSLTNLYNRRYFNIVYDRELKRAKRTKSHITFMMLDIDYFKQYNDTYGHLEGDEALKSVAQVLKDTLKRPADFVFRLGGEEFGVLFTETDESNSANIARDICDAIREKKIEHKTSKAHKYLTMSIGVVSCKATDELNEEVLLSRADGMLYKSKDSGRDTYSITTNVSEQEPLVVSKKELSA